jgi:glycogen operon protein
MLLGGDELGRSQQGNNNAYCQDNEISWVNWDQLATEMELLTFLREIIAIRQNHPVFRRRNFFQGRAIKGAGVKDILWLRPDGREMTDEEWNQEHARTLGVFLSGSAVDEVDERGQLITDEDFVLLMNAHYEEVPFLLPSVASGMSWISLIDTAQDGGISPAAPYDAMTQYRLQPRSLALLQSLASLIDSSRDQARQGSAQ